MRRIRQSYPRKCMACRSREVWEAEVEKIIHKRIFGKEYELDLNRLPADLCHNCGAVYLTAKSNDYINEVQGGIIRNL